MREMDNFYLSKEEPNRSCFMALQRIILNLDEDMSETRKYGMPCFCYKKKMCFYLWTDKKVNEPYILFVDGKHLDHPQLEAGTRARMKIFRVNPHQDIPLKTLQGLLNQALDLHRSDKISIK